MIHTTPITIRFADIDAMGHVNNAKYLTYLEYARMVFADEIMGPIDWKSKGFILARTEINFIQPILLRDKIIIETQCTRMGNKSFDLSYKIMKCPTPTLPSGEGVTSAHSSPNANVIEMANAMTVLVGFDYKNNVAIPIPEEWKKKLSPP